MKARLLVPVRVGIVSERRLPQNCCNQDSQYMLDLGLVGSVYLVARITSLLCYTMVPGASRLTFVAQ